MSTRAKYSFLLGLLGIAAFVAAAILWQTAAAVSLTFAYGGVSFLLLSAAYAKVGPRILGKRPDGSMSPAAWVLFAPYHLLNAFAFWTFRTFSGRAPLLHVTPRLTFGRRMTNRDIARLGLSRDVAILDLTAEFPEIRAFRNARAYRCLPLLDATAPTPQQLQEAIAWLKTVMAEGPAYIHCALGNERSATIVVAWLLATGAEGSLEEALTSLRSQRPGVRLHPEQAKAIQMFLNRET